MSIRSLFCTFMALAVVALGPMAAQAQSREEPRPAGAAAQPIQPVGQVAAKDDGYVIGNDDVVEVEVLGRSDFRVRGKIGSDGALQLPYVGSMPAAGKTALQLGADIKASLEKGGYYRNPVLRVEIVGYASRYVTVLGAVGAPGLVPVDRPYRLSDILARVGGVREGGADYVVLTPEKGEARNVSIKTLATGSRSEDPFVSPGDKIFIDKAKVYYISGQVRSPGAYPVSDDLTIRMAIGKAGGLTDIGSDKGIKVTHTNGKVEKMGMNGKVMPDDVINVGERLF